MKKYIGLMSIILSTVVFFSSCTKTETEDFIDSSKEVSTNSLNVEQRDSSVSVYPESIDLFVSENFPESSIVDVSVDDSGSFEVELSDGTELLFDAAGVFDSIESDTAEGTTGDSEDDDEDGDSEDDDEDGDSEDYDEDGDSEDDDEDGDSEDDDEDGDSDDEDEDGDSEDDDEDGDSEDDDEDGDSEDEDEAGDSEDEDEDGDSEDEDETVVTEYPGTIIQYILANFPELTIVEVTLDADGNYEVELSDGTELLFDALGIFIG